MATVTGTSAAADPAGDLAAALQPVGSRAALAAGWRALERRGDGSFFQSWAWIGCWLRHLPAGTAPRLLTVTSGTEAVGLGLLVSRRETRRGVLQVRGLHLNETGDPAVDPLGLEYNGMLLDRRVSPAAAARACLQCLVAKPDDWDELTLPGLDRATAGAWAEAAKDYGLRLWVRAEEPCDFVDLAELRRTGDDYLARLSRNTRQQVRRSMRLYEASGRLSVEAAATAEEADAVLAELKSLHQAYWTRRGQSGAFARGCFEAFHRDLVAREFESGSIQLLRVSAGRKVVGCLYNLVHKGRVHAYQSGFRYEPDPRLKPGLVSHCLAIEHNRASGGLTYDFMAGAARHKRSLASRSEPMVWLTLQRPRAGLRVESAVRDAKRKLSARAARRSAKPSDPPVLRFARASHV